MSGQGKVVLVDFFGSAATPKELDAVAKACKSIEDVTLVICLCDDAKSKIPTTFTSVCPASTKVVTNAIKVNAVLMAKALLDEDKVKNVHVISDTSRQSWWEEMLKVGFTPYYNIVQLHVTVTSQRGKPDVDVSLVPNEIDKYLRSLPGNGEIKVLRSPNIPSGVFVHGFSTRYGGLSPYPGMKSLNLLYTTKKPDPEALIRENVRRFADVAGFNGGKLHVAAANHGIQVWTIGEEKPNGYDAIVSNSPGVVVAAPSADCTLVLFADPVNKCCGAAHAGWRGTMTSEGVAMTTVKTMAAKFGTNPKDVLVAIGPSIGTCCYEFGEEESKQFSELDPRCVVRKPGHPKPFVDVAIANRIQLERGGVPAGNIDMSNTLCTKCHPDKFFSYRRDGTPFGNQIGFIGVKGGE